METWASPFCFTHYDCDAGGRSRSRRMSYYNNGPRIFTPSALKTSKSFVPAESFGPIPDAPPPPEALNTCHKSRGLYLHHTHPCELRPLEPATPCAHVSSRAAHGVSHPFPAMPLPRHVPPPAEGRRAEACSGAAPGERSVERRRAMRMDRMARNGATLALLSLCAMGNGGSWRLLEPDCGGPVLSWCTQCRPSATWSDKWMGSGRV